MTAPRPVLCAVALGLAGCAYFNGIYNAREAERAADKLLRKGREAEAAGHFATAAVKAETVLARYPKSRWSPEALYLAGRGEAFSDQCAQAEHRLTAYLELRAGDRVKRERATLALGRCLVRLGRYSEARELLAPLARARDRAVAQGAALWAARASIALGQTDSALTYLASVDASPAQWELAAASLARQEYARAESLLALRASRGDYREQALDAVRELWAAGRRAPAEALVARFDRARTPVGAKARLHLLLADLQIAAAQDSAARQHLLRAQRLAVDTVADREASVRLTLLSLRDQPTLADVRAAVERSRRTAGASPLQQRLEEGLLLLGILADRTDYTGASAFLAAEVARDSLRARSLAHALFRRVADEAANSPLAPKALLAAAALLPDSADAYRRRLLERYPRSPFAALVDGGAAVNETVYQQTDVLLRQAWATAATEFATALQRRRSATGDAAAQTPPAP